MSLGLAPGETLALVGESGCGKSTTGRLLVGLERPSQGSVLFEGRELSTLSAVELRRLRGRMQLIFQDPYASLNPRFTVARTLAEPLRIHLGLTGPAARRRVIELLETVGLAAEHAGRYPHEFSGGQRQRVAIARAIATAPRFVVADEPVSALDVSIQGQIMRLLLRLKRECGLTMLFISHDLSTVRTIADRTAVMYRGRVVELAPTEELFARPLHPYTRLLLDSVLPAEPGGDEPGRPAPPPPRAWPEPAACAFHGRCPGAGEDCRGPDPGLREVVPGHLVACRRALEGVPRGQP